MIDRDTINFLATDLQVGDRIHYRDLDVAVIGPQEPLENQFGLPWFKYLVEAPDGRRGHAKFGPGGHVLKWVES